MSYGRFNTQRYQAYATTGLGGGVAMDVEGLFTKGNGFLTNILNGDDHVGAYQNWTVRSGLKFELSDKVLARYTHSRENDPTAILTNSNTDTTTDPTTGMSWGVQTLKVPGFYTTNPNQVAANLPTSITSNTDIAQLTVKADLSFANLTSYSQWRREDVNQSEDLDQTGLPIFQLGLPIYNRPRCRCVPNGRIRPKNTLWLCSATTSPTSATGPRSSTTASGSVLRGVHLRPGVWRSARNFEEGTRQSQLSTGCASERLPFAHNEET